MKKLLFAALLAVSAITIVNKVDARHAEHGGCSRCSAANYSCGEKPTCVKLVEAFEPACKSCNLVCDYTCPEGTTPRFEKGF